MSWYFQLLYFTIHSLCYCYQYFHMQALSKRNYYSNQGYINMLQLLLFCTCRKMKLFHLYLSKSMGKSQRKTNDIDKVVVFYKKTRFICSKNSMNPMLKLRESNSLSIYLRDVFIKNRENHSAFCSEYFILKIFR